MAGADVYALAAGTAYASSEEIQKLTGELARIGTVSDRIQLVYQKDPAFVGAADIVTNSGQVRPIDASMIAQMKPSCVVPLTSGFRLELATLTICNEKVPWPGRIGLVKGPVRPSRRHFSDEE
jgi:hypothetical protein